MTSRFLDTLKYILLVVLVCCTTSIFAQARRDSLTKEVPASKLPAVADTLNNKKVDSVLHVHSPRTAAIRSAIIPGWGQVYNKRYWKLPLVYGALGTSAGIFVYNLTWYKRTRYAFKVLYSQDTANYKNVHTKLQALINNNDVNGLKNYRDEFRRNVDYSVLFFAVLWGLNVVDASVDAHLKSFDVSPELGLQFKAGYSELANTNGLSLILSFK